MRTILLLVAAFLVPQVAASQDPSAIRQLFEGARYEQVVKEAGPDSPPSVQYTAAQSYQRLNSVQQAIEVYGRLAALPESDPWHFIGLSGRQNLANEHDAALGSAQQAVNMAGDLPEAHYQLGIVQGNRRAWPEAAASFSRTAELNPSDAYAHYYAGLMYSRAKRTDRMAIHFDQFLALAPEAPERPEVMQIMKTVRGR